MSNLTPIKPDSSSFMHVMSESQKQAMDEQMQKLKSEKETLQKKNEAFQAENADLRGRVSEQGETIESQQKQISELGQEVIASNARADKAEAERDALSSENVTLKGRISDLETTNTLQNEKISKQGQELIDSRAEREALQGRVSEQGKQIIGLQSENAALTEEITSLHRRFTRQDEIIEGQQKKISELGQEIIASTAKTENMLEKMEEMAERFEKLQGENTTLAKDNRELNAEKNKNAQIKAQLLNSFIQKRQRSILRKAFSALRNSSTQSLKKENAELLKELEPVRKARELAAAYDRDKLNKKPELTWMKAIGEGLMHFNKDGYEDISYENSDPHGLGGLGIGTMF